MKKEITAVVRHYRTPNSDHHPYRGKLKDGTDLGGNPRKELNDYLAELPDGEKIKITIESFGESPTAHGFVWSLSEPHTYVRMTREEYDEMSSIKHRKRSL